MPISHSLCQQSKYINAEVQKRSGDPLRFFSAESRAQVQSRRTMSLPPLVDRKIWVRIKLNLTA